MKAGQDWEWWRDVLRGGMAGRVPCGKAAGPVE